MSLKYSELKNQNTTKVIGVKNSPIKRYFILGLILASLLVLPVVTFWMNYTRVAHPAHVDVPTDNPANAEAMANFLCTDECSERTGI